MDSCLRRNDKAYVNQKNSSDGIDYGSPRWSVSHQDLTSYPSGKALKKWITEGFSYARISEQKICSTQFDKILKI
jgi:hypothetical protein